VSSFRVAGEADAVALRDLERAASLAALGHIFPAERFPYPDDDVLARWHLVLADPTVSVRLREEEDAPVCLVAYDEAGTLRHLAVHPARWGAGLAGEAVRLALASWRAAGLSEARLWCLAENHRARARYERWGWRLTGAAQEAPWAPYPRELEYRLSW
jgi:RimJ/RimL family protein N-acetyltransferase